MNFKIEKQAADFRNKYGFSNFDSIHLKSLLIKLNVITIFKPLSANFSGMAVKVNDNRFMLINSKHSIGRQHFSICHELYHLFIQEDFKPHHSQSGRFKKEDTIEYCADLFAAHLLMPKDGIVSLLPDKQLKKDKITLENILKLENYFSCSRSALLYRLKELKLISPKKYEEYKTDVIRSACRYGYTDTLYRPGNENTVIGNYGTIARKLFENDKISEGHYIELMNAIGFNTTNNASAHDID